MRLKHHQFLARMARMVRKDHKDRKDPIGRMVHMVHMVRMVRIDLDCRILLDSQARLLVLVHLDCLAVRLCLGDPQVQLLHADQQDQLHLWVLAIRHHLLDLVDQFHLDFRLHLECLVVLQDQQDLQDRAGHLDLEALALRGLRQDQVLLEDLEDQQLRRGHNCP